MSELDADYSATTRHDDTDLLVLDDRRLIDTIEILQQRISERFPNSGLSRLCDQLLAVSRKASARAVWISEPNLWICGLGYILAVGMISFILAVIFHSIRADEFENMTFIRYIEVSEPGVNLAIFLSIAIYFLISFETRIKRRRALAAVHELRSIAHIIDMHQLTKDPERVLGNWMSTEHSPKQQMTPFQLNRYLDYCSEMLALTGKIASLYVQRFDDADSIAAVSELEQLCTGLSRKIWQKIIASRSIVAGNPSTAALGQTPPTGSSDAATSAGDSSDPETHDNVMVD